MLTFGKLFFCSVKCRCKLDIENQSEDEQKYIFNIYPQNDNDENNQIKFIYGTKDGLINVNKDTYISVLPDILAIKDNDVEDLKSFILNHGFLFPLNPNKKNKFESEKLFGIINRLIATYNLMNELVEEKKDWKKIFTLSIYLLLSPSIEINLFNYDSSIKTCPYEIETIWNKPYISDPDDSNTYNNHGDLVIIKDHRINYNVPIDSKVYNGDTINITSDTYNEAIGGGVHGYNSGVFSKTLFYLVHYSVEPLKDDYTRLAFELLCLFCKGIGEIKSWSHTGDLVFTETVDVNEEKFNNLFDKQFQDALLDLARYTLKTEIDYNLGGIALSYDTKNMESSWSVKSLLSLLYFSLFYMDHKKEIYRKCANERCGRLFLTNKNVDKKRYCTPSCANAKAQRKYRENAKK